MLDHFQGNRTPYTDALSRGAITGLTLSTRRPMSSAPSSRGFVGDPPHHRQLRRSLHAEAHRAGGRGRTPPLWLQIHADTIGAPIELTEVADAPALGCAILAAHGAGKYRSIEEGVAAMVRSKTVIELDAANTRFYESEMLPRYAKLYGALKSVRG